MMSKKNHSPGPVPPGNKSQAGPRGPQGQETDQEQAGEENTGAPFQEQDPKRRLGDFNGAGEHSIQQPSRLNDGDTHRQ
jgi:hypothetical protein